MAEEKIEKKKPDWVKIKPAELEKIIVELYKEGNSPAKIGLILRDKHSVPKAKLLGKRITEFLKDAKVNLRPENERINERIESLNRHIEKNKHDQPAKKQLVKQLWALKRVAKEAAA
jgi:small subunit ribosomal protein S15